MIRIKDIFFNQRNRIAIAGVMSLVWWCVFYPELCFPDDSYEIVCDAESSVNIEDEIENDIDGIEGNTNISSGENYPKILQADDEQIVIGSRLLEWLIKKKN